jgi:hypothetical protein
MTPVATIVLVGHPTQTIRLNKKPQTRQIGMG